MHEHTHDHHDIPLDALLAHMTEHNESHASELEHLAHHAEGEVSDRILRAAELMRQGNEELKKALAMVKEK